MMFCTKHNQPMKLLFTSYYCEDCDKPQQDVDAVWLDETTIRPHDIGWDVPNKFVNGKLQYINLNNPLVLQILLPHNDNSLFIITNFSKGTKDIDNLRRITHNGSISILPTPKGHSRLLELAPGLGGPSYFIFAYRMAV